MQLFGPRGIAIDQNGMVYVSDLGTTEFRNLHRGLSFWLLLIIRSCVIHLVHIMACALTVAIYSMLLICRTV